MKHEMKQIISAGSHPGWLQLSLHAIDPEARVSVHLTLGPGDMNLLKSAIENAIADYKPWILANFEPIDADVGTWYCLYCECRIVGTTEEGQGAVAQMETHMAFCEKRKARLGLQ